MIVWFISHSSKNGTKRVRNILDNFAERLAGNTWRTNITMAGLDAIKEQLNKIVTKQVFVIAYKNDEILWQIGRVKYNDDGYPIATTKKIIEFDNNWDYLENMKKLVAVVGVLHDIGKKNDWFQYKLRLDKPMADPYRHEFISCKILEAVYTIYKDNWKNALIEGFDEDKVKEYLSNEVKNNHEHRLNNDIPYLLKVINYFILTHHRLPKDEHSDDGTDKFFNFDEIFTKIDANWYYKNEKILKEEKDAMNKNFSFSHGLNLDEKNKKIIKRYLLNMNEENYKHIFELKNTRLFPLFYSFTRTFLMLADYKVSSKKEEKDSLENEDICIANKVNGKAGQLVEDHLYEVSKEATQIAHLFQYVINKLPSTNNKKLVTRAGRDYNWQNKVIDTIKKYKNGHKTESNVFFCTNMASTGKGKTFANAKIINAMSNNLRYILAVGLRTLVLQTGDEYVNKDSIGFKVEEVTIRIGSEPYKELYDNYKEENIQNKESYDDLEEDLTQCELDFDNFFKEPELDFLNVLLQGKQEKNNKAFLYKPVLVCTIDYMMRLTQTVKGGKYILPLLRLFSSDLIIDEIDDFNLQDLRAIQHLAYYTGLFGRNFIISSATISQDLAESMQIAYERGIRDHNIFFNVEKKIVNVICDEFTTRISDKDYHSLHEKFLTYRIKKLNDSITKCKGEILQVKEKTLESYYQTIMENIYKLHDNNYFTINNKRVSIGCIRTANVGPCVELTKQILNENHGKYTVRALCYHSRQPMLMRMNEENYLNHVLKRKGDYLNTILKDDSMMEHINNGFNDIIFIVVATTVEEIGRDHDFDWTIIEPSSIHSIVQMCGRVRRHRHEKEGVKNINVGILQYNYAYIVDKYKGRCFVYPGVEGNSNIRMELYDMNLIIDKTKLDSITSVPSIKTPKDITPNKVDKKYFYFDKLNTAEHFQQHQLNDILSTGSKFLNGYTEEYWILTGMPQTINKFRKNQYTTINCIETIENGKRFFNIVKNNKLVEVPNQPIKEDEFYNYSNLWKIRKYDNELEDLRKKNKYKDKIILDLSRIFGQVSIIVSSDFDDEPLYFDDNFGVYKK